MSGRLAVFGKDALTSLRRQKLYSDKPSTRNTNVTSNLRHSAIDLEHQKSINRNSIGNENKFYICKKKCFMKFSALRKVLRS